MIPIAKIHPDSKQPRKTFHDESIQSLSESIRENGVITPLLVRPNGDGYIIVAGERRHRACVLAGLTAVPCIIKSVNDFGALKLSLIENLQREDLSPFEEAAAYKTLTQEFEVTQEELGEIVGKSASLISRMIRLNDLPEPLREKLAHAQVARSLLLELVDIDDMDIRSNLATRMIEEKISREDVRTAIRQKKNGRKIISATIRLKKSTSSYTQTVEIFFIAPATKHANLS
jgi:ParB family chromosome partitioning protein